MYDDTSCIAITALTPSESGEDTEAAEDETSAEGSVVATAPPEAKSKCKGESAEFPAGRWQMKSETYGNDLEMAFTQDTKGC